MNCFSTTINLIRRTIKSKCLISFYVFVNIIKNRDKHGVEMNYNYVDLYSERDYLNILKKFPINSTPCIDSQALQFYYQNKESEECVKLHSDWNIPFDSINEAKKTLQQICEVMRWFKGYFLFRKTFENKKGIEKIIETADYKLINEKLTNGVVNFTCFFESLFFLYSLLAIGFKARIIKCMSLGFDVNGIYYVEVFINDYNKWIVIDITNSIVFYDDNIIPLNIAELRNRMIDNKELIVYTNGSSIDDNIYFRMIKNLFRIQYYLNNKIDMMCEKTIESIILCHNSIKGSEKHIVDSVENKKYIFKYLDNSWPIYNA